MSRNIEQIVDSHRRASALRAAGRPIWSRTISIRPIINESDDESVERIVDVGRRVAAALRQGLGKDIFDITNDAYDRDLDEAVEDIENYTVDGLVELAAEGVDPLEMFNGRLDEIYDWADRDRVWLG